MLKNLKNKKKKGFTLVELVVVIAIIAILAAVLVPQITGYIENARKTEVIQEAREIVTAVESVEATTGKKFDDTVKWSKTNQTLGTNDAIKNLVGDIRTIKDQESLGNIKKVVDSENYTFSVEKVDGVYVLKEVKSASASME